MRLWINEQEFVEIPAGERDPLTREIASRARSIDFWGLGTYLPDPDPILRKTGQDVRVYEELLADPHVFSCYQSRKGGTLSCEWRIDWPEGAPDRRLADLLERLKGRLDVRRIVSEILDAPFFGFAMLEVLWEADRGMWLPRDVVGKPNEWFVFDNENRLRFLSAESQLEGEPLPRRKFLLAQHHPSYKNPYGLRVLSRCFWPVAFKKGGFKFWAIFTEKYGMPWVVGKVPRGTQENERQAVLSMLQQMVQDAVAVINDDESVEIREASGKGASAEIYAALIKAANREISKAVLGQTLTTEVGDKGSYAATLGHLKVRQDLVDSDKDLVCQTVNTLLRWVTELNFPDAGPPVLRFYEEEDIQKDRAERDEILTRQGVRLTAAYYQRAYNLKEDDFELGTAEQGAEFQEPRITEPQITEPQITRIPQIARITEPRITEPRIARTTDCRTTDCTDSTDYRTTDYTDSTDCTDYTEHRGGQQAIDELIERMAGRRDVLDPMLQPVLDRVVGAASFEQIMEQLYELHPRMDTGRFEELLRQALFAADLWGYLRAREESGARS